MNVALRSTSKCLLAEALPCQAQAFKRQLEETFRELQLRLASPGPRGLPMNNYFLTPTQNSFPFSSLFIYSADQVKYITFIASLGSFLAEGVFMSSAD